MNSNSKSFVLFLIFIWSIYVAWEFDVQTAIKTYPDSITRYDLLILPCLIIFTAYAVHILIRNQDTDKN
jgi:hypothetical protein